MNEPENPSRNASAPVISVSELNRMARRVVESALPLMWIEGEISNFMRAASGHWYFSLKDATAQVRCAMFRGRNQLAGLVPANGDRVEVRAVPTLYEARGEFQLGVEAIRRAGSGQLFEAFLKLKAKLDAEGLFEPARKRALPAFPRCVGVVTSLQAAALRDVLSALARRMPSIRVVLYPTPVQGVDAPAQIANAIAVANARAECDVLIVCRGGGSIEDLWAFNDERVARAVAASGIPLVSGVGHETDFTLTDFAADLRAPTPTAAAELASPQRHDLLNTLARLADQLERCFLQQQRQRAQTLDDLSRRLVHPADALRRRRGELDRLGARLAFANRHHLRACALGLDALAARVVSPAQALGRARLRVDHLSARQRQAMAAWFASRQQRLARAADALAHLDPDQVLARGYSRVSRADGSLVRDSASLSAGDVLVLRFQRGEARAEVVDTRDTGQAPSPHPAPRKDDAS